MHLNAFEAIRRLIHTAHAAFNRETIPESAAERFHGPVVESGSELSEFLYASCGHPR